LTIPAFARNRRNYFFVPVLILLGAAELAMHLSYQGRLAWPVQASVRAGLDLVLFILAIMAGRVVPMFTNNGVPSSLARRNPLIEQLGGTPAVRLPQTALSSAAFFLFKWQCLYVSLAACSCHACTLQPIFFPVYAGHSRLPFLRFAIGQYYRACELTVKLVRRMWEGSEIGVFAGHINEQLPTALSSRSPLHILKRNNAGDVYGYRVARRERFHQGLIKRVALMLPTRRNNVAAGRGTQGQIDR
jgi:hypothetical protein